VAMMLFSALDQTTGCRASTTGKVLLILFKNTVVVHSTDTDNTTMVGLFSFASCLT